MVPQELVNPYTFAPYSTIPPITTLHANLFGLRLGRTTFVNTLCGKKVLQTKDCDDYANAHVEEGVRIKPVTVGMCSVAHALEPLDGSLTKY